MLRMVHLNYKPYQVQKRTIEFKLEGIVVILLSLVTIILLVKQNFQRKLTLRWFLIGQK